MVDFIEAEIQFEHLKTPASQALPMYDIWASFDSYHAIQHNTYVCISVAV